MKTLLVIVALFGMFSLCAATGSRNISCEVQMGKRCDEEKAAIMAAWKRNDTNLMKDIAQNKKVKDYAVCKKYFTGCQETMCEITLMSPMHCEAVEEMFSCVYKECGCGEWSQRSFLKAVLDEAEIEMYLQSEAK